MMCVEASRRRRRRGPRSQIANLRRSVPKHRRTLPGLCLGESRHLGSESIYQLSPRSLHNLHDSKSEISADNSKGSICIYFVNIQCMLAHLAELAFQLEVHRPHIVCLQETWLDESVKEVKVAGYTKCSRRDRHPGANRGGVMTLVRDDFNGLAFIKDSDDEERSWHFLKSGVDTILLANWYRPGASEFDGFSTLYAEFGEYFSQVSGVILVGDFEYASQEVA